MTIEEKNCKVINKLVVKGVLPFGFYNSKITKKKTTIASDPTKFLFLKYKQYTIPYAENSTIISKIYNVL